MKGAGRELGLIPDKLLHSVAFFPHSRCQYQQSCAAGCRFHPSILTHSQLSATPSGGRTCSMLHWRAVEMMVEQIAGPRPPSRSVW